MGKYLDANFEPIRMKDIPTREHLFEEMCYKFQDHLPTGLLLFITALYN